MAELTANSPEFADLWQRYDVARWQREDKTFHHPEVGTLTVTGESLRIGENAQRLTVYQAEPGSTDQEALTLLSAAASLLR